MKQQSIQTQEQVLYALNTLVPEGQTFEIRILGYDDGRGYKKILGGFFDDRQKAARIAAQYEAHSDGIYFTLNAVTPNLLARCYNEVKACKDANDGKTADKNIIRRKLMPLDFDPVREPGISSTDEELVLAVKKRDIVVAWLMDEMGFPEPIQAMSGNGSHALWDIDLPNDDNTRDILSLFYQALDQRFSDATVKTDISIFNAARIWKMYGTLARKGVDFPTRPHRRSEITSVPEQRYWVTVEQIQSVADMFMPELKNTKVVARPTNGTKAAYTSQAQPSNGHRPANGVAKVFDLEQWMDVNDITYRNKKSSPDRDLYVLSVCPFNSDHTNGAAIITQEVGGKLGFKCHHDSCTGKDWRALRDMVEPESRERREAFETGTNKTVSTTKKTVDAGDAPTAPKDYRTSDIVESLTYLGYSFRLNELTGRVDVNETPITDPIDATIIAQMYDLGYKRKEIIQTVILAEAQKSKYHPIKDYLNGLVWDGQPIMAT